MKTHPVQAKPIHQASTDVTLAAYEVYSHVYSPQEALITGHCRGGFCNGELIAFLYARSYPKDQWRKRVEDAFASMNP